MLSDAILTGDVGGTNTRLQIFRVDPSMVLSYGRRAPGRSEVNNHYKNEDFNQFSDILRRFFQDSQIALKSLQIRVAVFAVAGPVSNNRVSLTNRGSWIIDGVQLATEFRIERVSIINDFYAVGYGLLTIEPEERTILNPSAEVVQGAPIACLGSGTGLGECYLTSDSSGKYSCYSSEGGHTEFAPRNEAESCLLEHIHKLSNNRVSVERVVSGLGIVNIYDYLKSTGRFMVDVDLDSRIDTSGDLKAATIAMAANSQTPDLLCVETMKMFMSAYGSEAGNVCLKFLPRGGLFVVGSMSVKNADLIRGKDSEFMVAYKAKGRMCDLVSSVPIILVMAEDVGERGAHVVGFELYKKLSRHPTNSNSIVLIGLLIAAFAFFR